MRTIEVATEKPYQVLVEDGILSRCGQMIAEKTGKGSAVKAAVITDSNVGPLYLDTVISSLEAAGMHAVSYVFPAGEESKNIRIYSDILGFLAGSRITRSDFVVALGGGVTGDLAGFAAATYLRGIAYVQIPTSLLAMVDSSVGGKTAIDLPEGKNLAGAFCQPQIVICDPQVLETLPENVFRDGCAEVIKYGVLEDEQLFAHLAANGMNFDRQKVIADCIQIKSRYVTEDEFDYGIRRKLNLGHTFGHAIEADSHFTVTHGQAVAAGMCMMARASRRMGLCRRGCADGIEACVSEFGLPVTCKRDAEALLPYIQADKKRRGDTVSLIVPVRIGECDIVTVPAGDILSWLKAGLAS